MLMPAHQVRREAWRRPPTPMMERPARCRMPAEGFHADQHHARQLGHRRLDGARITKTT
jgi:hypothetical protein